MPNIDLQPTRVRTGYRDTEGRLAMVDGELVAVLVRLDDPVHEKECGRWFMEIGFGPCGSRSPPTFQSLQEVAGWIRDRLR